MPNLSPHFSRAELIHTDTGIDNTPDSDDIWSRLALVAAMLERVRDLLDVPIKVNSGYRNHAVNIEVHGSDTSAHSLGLAADIVPQGIELDDAYQTIRTNLLCDIDQLIWEQKALWRGGYVKWIHIGLGHMGPTGQIITTPRRQALIYSPKTNGRYLLFDTQYVAI